MALNRNCQPCYCSIPCSSGDKKLCFDLPTDDKSVVTMRPNGQKCVGGTVENCTGIEWCVEVTLPFKICENLDIPLPAPVEVTGCCRDELACFVNDPDLDGILIGIKNSNGEFSVNQSISGANIYKAGGVGPCWFDLRACFTVTGAAATDPVCGFVQISAEQTQGKPPCEWTSHIYVPVPVDPIPYNTKYPYYANSTVDIVATGYAGIGTVSGAAPIG